MESCAIEGEIPETIRIWKEISLSGIFHGVTLSEYALLKITMSMTQKSKSGAVYVTEIAQKLKSSVPAVSKSLKTLEAKGLIKRETCKENRRKTIVYLTDMGNAVKENSDREFSDFFTGIYKKIGKEDMDRFNMLARKISAAIIDELRVNRERGEIVEQELLRNHA